MHWLAGKSALGVLAALVVGALVTVLVTVSDETEAQAGTFSYTPTEDARVLEGNASSNYGALPKLRTDSGGANLQVESYLQFTVTDLPARETVQSAKLYLWVPDDYPESDEGTVNGPAVYTSPTDWSESTITWENKPAKSGSGVADKGAIAQASWVEFDVTPLVTGNATYSFVLSQPSIDSIKYASKEYSDTTKKPQLVITTDIATDTSSTLVGAGDIATCSNQNDEATAKLLDGIAGTVFAAGDNVYNSGTDDEFNNCYDPTWGRHKARTTPAAGNHEYETANASGYFNYFGAAAGWPSKGYYSYDLSDWHVIVLNSNCSQVGGCSIGSPQEQWLRADLAAHPNSCTLAYFHYPLFSSVRNHPSVGPFWDALYEANADVVLSGHAHSYERFAPQDPFGAADPVRGIREFVVGTGGAGLHSFGTIQPNSEVRESNTHGVLKLTLHPTSYEWEFVPVAGKTFTDSGSSSCH
jgi:acid phosphatase type 7